MISIEGFLIKKLNQLNLMQNMVTKTTQMYLNWEYCIVIQVGLDSKGVRLRVSIKVEIPRRGGHWILRER